MLKLSRTIAIAALAVAAATAFAQDTTAPPPDPNYAQATGTMATMSVAWAQAHAVKAQALPAAVAACAKMAGELAQGLCVLAVTGSIGSAGGSGAASLMPAVSLPAPPPPSERPLNWWEALIRAPAALFDAAVKLGPSWAQYALGKATVQSQERIAIAQTLERRDLYATFGSMNSSSMGAISSVANQGFITLGGIPQGTTYNVTNSTGVGFGAGNVAVGSYNPRTCSGGQAGAGASGGAATTGTTTAGSGGPGGAANC